MKWESRIFILCIGGWQSFINIILNNYQLRKHNFCTGHHGRYSARRGSRQGSLNNRRLEDLLTPLCLYIINSKLRFYIYIFSKIYEWFASCGPRFIAINVNAVRRFVVESHDSYKNLLNTSKYFSKIMKMPFERYTLCWIEEMGSHCGRRLATQTLMQAPLGGEGKRRMEFNTRCRSFIGE